MEASAEIQAITITNSSVASDILALQTASYRVEADIIGYYDIPPLHDTLDSLQTCGETFYGYYIKGELCGAISIKKEKSEVDIHRLVVSPNHLKKGIAQALFNYIEALPDVKTVIVSTASKNNPAITFYIKNGFRKLAETKITDQLFLTSFKKNL